MRRRLFLSSLILAPLLRQKAWAFPMDRLLSHPKQSYVHEFIRRYWTWYQKTWFPFEKHMSPAETNLFKHWRGQVNHFGLDFPEGTYIETFMTRHHLFEQSIRHGSLYCGLESWDKKGLQLFKNFLTEFYKDFQWQDPLLLFGWSHNFDEAKVKVWYRLSDDQSLMETTEEGRPLLGFIEYDSGGEIRRGLVLKPAQVRFTPEINSRSIYSAFKVVDSNGKVAWKYRTKGTFLLTLKKGVKRVTTPHTKEFRSVGDFLEPNGQDSLKIYYP